MKQLNEDLMQHISSVEFLLGQILYMGPLNAPIWALGLWWLVASRHGAKYRAFGLACVVEFFIFVVAKAKVYYLVPVYPMLFAGGALLIESAIPGRGCDGRRLRCPRLA